MRLRHGVYSLLEDKATELILASLEGTTSREEKSDILTPWKEKHRAKREILTSTGVADPSVRRGQFTRAWNPDRPQLNSRDCPTQPVKMSSSWDPEEGAVTGSLSSEMSAVYGVERED